MTIPLRAPFLYLALLLVSAFGAPAHAATAGTPNSSTAASAVSPAQATPKPAKAKHKKKSTKVTFDKGSAESTAERDRRLYRECKGRPNAGACLGYAS